MKTARLLAGILILVNGILHIIMYFQTQDKPGIIGVLAFGIIYCITGFLLFNRKVYPIYLGLIIPIIGMTLSVIKFGMPELLSMMSLFKVIDIIVAVLCCYLLISQKKGLQSHQESHNP